jgi:hypothetical protein
MNMGASLLQWFLFCVLVSLFCAFIAIALPPGTDPHRCSTPSPWPR